MFPGMVFCLSVGLHDAVGRCPVMAGVDHVQNGESPGLWETVGIGLQVV
jgi:hypothetical protein